ncbi:MAG: hypothetical protein AAGG56_18760, partial [Pseudomonadota bacterium]
TKAVLAQACARLVVTGSAHIRRSHVDRLRLRPQMLAGSGCDLFAHEAGKCHGRRAVDRRRRLKTRPADLGHPHGVIDPASASALHRSYALEHNAEAR